MKPSERLAMIRRAVALYHPCSCGIHICGDKDGEAATFGNVQAKDEAQARAIFAACKAETEKHPDEPQEFVVDLNLSWDNLHVEDFCITRQMLDRCLAVGRRTLSHPNQTEPK